MFRRDEIANRCAGLVGLIRGHKFEPRYDQRDLGSGPPKELVEIALSKVLTSTDEINSLVAELGAAFGQSAEFYIQDVCVRCGAVVPRSTDEFPLGSDGYEPDEEPDEEPEGDTRDDHA